LKPGKLLRAARAALACLSLAGLPGCASSSIVFSSAPEAFLIEVTDAGLRPVAAREVPSNASVVWLNGTRERAITVTIRKDCQAEVHCATSTGFKCDGNRTASTGVLPPGAAASLCFHRPGSFDYDITGLDRPLQGRVLVR
jgi:hypothetical protein